MKLYEITRKERWEQSQGRSHSTDLLQDLKDLVDQEIDQTSFDQWIDNDESPELKDAFDALVQDIGDDEAQKKYDEILQDLSDHQDEYSSQD